MLLDAACQPDCVLPSAASLLFDAHPSDCSGWDEGAPLVVLSAAEFGLLLAPAAAGLSAAEVGLLIAPALRMRAAVLCRSTDQRQPPQAATAASHSLIVFKRNVAVVVSQA